MYLAEKRRIRDRKFIPYNPEKHLSRAFAVIRSHSGSWDLFPPIGGYKPYSSASKRSYTVSHQRQQNAWSKTVIARDNNLCKNCGTTENLEAHHVWPQGGFPNLRYVPDVGISLCRKCHNSAYHAPEITPGQFLSLTENMSLINANIEANNFWSYYTAGLEKGRVFAYGLENEKTIEIKVEEYECFLTWAKLNCFVKNSIFSANNSPTRDFVHQISPKVIADIENHRIDS